MNVCIKTVVGIWDVPKLTVDFVVIYVFFLLLNVVAVLASANG